MSTHRPAWDLAEHIRTERVDGEDWPFIDTGTTGPAVLMLPGSVGTCEMFFKQIADLAPSIRVIAISYPAISSPERLSDGLAGLMDRLALRRASVLGSSFAGYWIQYFALLHPERVENLFLGNSFVEPSELAKNPLFARDWVIGTSAAEIQRTWLDRVKAAPESELKQIQLAMLSGRQSAENLKARFVGVVDAKPCPPLTCGHHNITIIECDDDMIVPADSRRAVRDQYRGAQVESLPSGGHYPHILNSAAYNAIISTRLLSAATSRQNASRTA